MNSKAGKSLRDADHRWTVAVRRAVRMVIRPEAIKRPVARRLSGTCGLGRGSAGAFLLGTARLATPSTGNRCPGAFLPLVGVLVSLILCPLVVRAQATSMIDWLTFNPGGDRNHFSLLDDQGIAPAQAEIVIASGILAPTSPSSGVLQAPFWTTPPNFADSVLHTATVTSVKVQVAPQAGSVQYQLVITGADLSGMLFGVGQLFGSDSAGTRLLNISALTGASMAVPVALLSMYAWDDGIRFYTEPLAWDAGQQALSFDAGINGESEFAFFSVSSGGTPVTQLKFEIPNGYNGGAGDALEFAFGRPVPEPHSIALLMLGSLAASTRRRSIRRA